MNDTSRWVGRILRDKWRIDARLARGGVGTVYAATHRKNGSRAAIKVLHPEFSRDEDAKSRFLQEGYAANQVNHPGVVKILDDDISEEGLAFLVMELLEGELLERRRVRLGGTLPVTEVTEIGDQLLDVLALAHERGIVHRDIKPDNLFVTTEGRLKVLDFGFAQMRSGFRKEQTATGYLLGTPGFMSPEQAVGNRALIDARTDIWAVGATLFTLVSGRPVHEARSAAEMLLAAANQPVRSLATVASGAPLSMIKIVDRALAFDPRERFANARAMQSALRRQAGRPSISDIEEDDGSEERTLFFAAPIVVEQLDASHLESAPWEAEPHTLVATGRSSSPSLGNTLASAEAHPADEPGGNRTLVMASPTSTGPQRAMPAPLPAAGMPYVPPPRPSSPSFGDVRRSYADGMLPPNTGEMMFVAGPAQRPAPPPPPPGSRRVLAFVAVVALSMIVVVVTGLIILAGNE